MQREKRKARRLNQADAPQGGIENEVDMRVKNVPFVLETTGAYNRNGTGAMFKLLHQLASNSVRIPDADAFISDLKFRVAQALHLGNARMTAVDAYTRSCPASQNHRDGDLRRPGTIRDRAARRHLAESSGIRGPREIWAEGRHA